MNSRSLYSPEPAKGWIPWGALAPLLALAFVIGPMLGISLALADFQLMDDDGTPSGLPGIRAFLLLPFAAIGLLVLGWVRFVERRPLATIGLTHSTPGRFFLRGLAIGCVTIVVVVLASWAAGGYEARTFGAALRSPAALLDVVVLLLCFMVQASVEELVFRGWLLSAIARKFNVSLAVTLSSLIFCLLHFEPDQSWLARVNLVGFALFACAWALRSGNIWGVMGWHVGWNWLLATGFELPVTGIEVDVPALLVALTPSGPQYLTGGATGPEASVFCGVFFVGAMLVFRRRQRAA